MPKDRRNRSMSYERHSRASPFHCSSSTRHKHSSSSKNPTEPAAATKDIKEWEEARCPVCMEHPHNAVLLLCSSHDKGCRAYMCDTSYRHSNCLDQFRKTFSGATEVNVHDHQEMKNLSCPLCRGFVKGWTVVEPARSYMNAKTRSCSLESCGYSGTYGELRKHARTEHPAVRPSEADPERERDWRRLERQRDFGDLLSTTQPFFGGEERDFGVTVDDHGSHVNAHSTHLIVFYIRVSRSGDSGAARSLPWMPRVSSRGSTRGRRRRSWPLWGESFEGELGSTDGMFSDSDGEEDGDASEEVLSVPAEHTRERSRRRRMRMQDDEDLDLL